MGRSTSPTAPGSLGAGVASALGTAVLLVAVPMALVLTHAVPPVVAIGRALRDPWRFGHDLTTHVHGVEAAPVAWTAAWLVWLWFALCVGLEVVGRLRGRTPRPVPASGHLQMLTAWLVGAALVLVPSQRHNAPIRLDAVAVRAGPPPEAPATVPVTRPFELPGPPADAPGADVAPVALSAASAAVPAPAPDSAAEAPTYVVRPRDTLWSIAQRELGSPLAWRAIARANYGRPQPDGLALTDDHWIRPGWILVLPGAPTGSGPARGGVPAGTPTPRPLPGVVDGRLRAGTGAGAVPVVASPELTSLASPPLFATGASTTGQHRSTGAPRGDGSHLPVEPIGYGLIGAGIVALLDRLRRVQQRRRPAGLRIALPEGDLVELERGLRVSADNEAAAWIDRSLRMLSAAVRRGHLHPPQILAVRLTEEVVELWLDPAGPAQACIAPFEPADPGSTFPGRRWLLARSHQLLDAMGTDDDVMGNDAPLPALVSLGRDSEGLVVVNLERAGSVAVEGEDADRVVQAMAVELATSVWADQIDVVLVGFGDVGPGLDRIQCCGSLRAAQRIVSTRVGERRRMLGTAHPGTNPDSRWREGGQPWDLTVVVCSGGSAQEDPQALGLLIDAVGDGSLGAAVVCGTAVAEARWSVAAASGRIEVDRGPFDVPWPTLQAPHIPDDFVHAVSSLAAVAANTGGVAPADVPYREAGPVPGDALRPGPVPPGSVPEDEDDPGIDVLVLGPVDVRGAARPFSRAWTVELVVYLALHPGGVANDQWATALWPDRAMAPASLHSTASAARRALGTAASGEDHLPRSRGRLAMGPGVRSDWDRFVEWGRSADPGDWAAALGLIRGRPFDGLRSPDWVLLEGIQATIEAVVVDVACRFAEHCLAGRDARRAEWAARQGLRVSPYDERLYRVLLRTSDAAGNPAGVEAVMAELLHLVADDVEPYDAVHPETLALYHELSRRASLPRGR
ncbi:MAG TPA: LysM peptidoglycan-binding domain-containing protein [Acidimicrobiales bacterium]|nr:LysM peptidoglycan-binding domain-containing protein [Acidimicrobiales bacterium]